MGCSAFVVRGGVEQGGACTQRSGRRRPRSAMKKGMPMREAYRKAGLPPEDMDWEAMGMDIKTCGRELAVRPAK